MRIMEAKMKFVLCIYTFIYLTYNVVFTLEGPCNLKSSVNISDGVILENGSILKEGVVYNLENQIDGPDGSKLGCICRIIPCIRKCCPLDEYLASKNCTPTDRPLIKANSSLNNYHILIGNGCEKPKRRILVDPTASKKLNSFVVRPDGMLYIPHTHEVYYDAENYCLDYIDNITEPKALTCVSNNKLISATNVVGMIISMPFLLATFLVYALLPDRNLHGTSLMCYVLTLFGAYLLLVIIQLHPQDIEDNLCITVAIFAFFFFMVSFFMMNVMSIDIWWTFSGLRGFSGSRKEKERKRFLLYSGYAWGVPLLMVAIVVPLTLNDNLSSEAWYNPGIARGQCWFYEGVPKLVFFYGPIAILLAANLILFIITAYKIKRVQMETAVLKREDSRRHNYENDKQRFNLYLKLMLAMGINWSMEIISWVVNLTIVRVPIEAWYFTDFLNAAYGVFIFFIFVFKKNIWRLLKKRYYMMMGKPNLAKTITMVDYSPPITGSGNNNKNGVVNKQIVDDTSTSEIA
ncbi:hypothetical protein ILUMI_21146 [Ignelater luminosus]|uniref:G-protein coupled receptors family 2 profile 2 domain-containing protein n=1 Tax=Ignelater luminosus TaxID=2038154 RepID=A0A8K0FY85_IGNLU|nr:hypothetical protein ILUMI_21146 [Ignelater luminosus]